MKVKINYKDSLFRNIFTDKKRLCRLYRILGGKVVSSNDIENAISFAVVKFFVAIMA